MRHRDETIKVSMGVTDLWGHSEERKGTTKMMGATEDIRAAFPCQSGPREEEECESYGDLCFYRIF